MGLQTDSDGATIAGMVGYFYNSTFLERLQANLCYDKYGQQEPLPENKGETVIWHQLVNPSRGWAGSEGVSPGASAVSARKVSATLVMYEDLRAITDYVDMTAVCPIVRETVDAMGYGAALTKDYVIGDAIGFGSAASTGVADAASVALPSVYSRGFPVFEANRNSAIWTSRFALANGMFSTNPTIAHIRSAVTVLKNLNAVPFDDGNFRGVIDPTVSDRIRAATDFATWMAYTNRAAMEKGKLGVIEKVLFEESTNAINSTVLASAWSATYCVSGGTLYGTLIFGRGAYGVTKLGSKDAKVQVVTGADKTDPLNKLTMIGYKIYMASKILNPSAGVIMTWYNNNQ
jgi:N4-gp56 family major capsid protein